MKGTIRIFIILAAAVTLAPNPAGAEWSHDPAENNPVCNWTGEQYSPLAVGDGAGGLFVFWKDLRVDDGDIYAQRIDADGNPLWAVGGIPVCTAAGEQQYPNPVNDGAGGTIVSWRDKRSDDGDIYAQRIDGGGAVQWTADGVVVCAAAEEQNIPRLVSDGNGGAIISWQDWRWWNWDIWAQRVDAGGNMLWTADGTMVGVGTTPDQNAFPITDGAGGAIIVWHRLDDSLYRYHAQRLDSSGAVQWAADGIPVCPRPEDQQNGSPVSDGQGGVMVVFEEMVIGNHDIYAQRLDGSGSPYWAADGVAVCTAAENQLHAKTILTTDGAFIISWTDERNGLHNDIYAQRVNPDGTVPWTADGMRICGAAGTQYIPSLTPNDSGGAFIGWRDERYGDDQDIFVQQVDADGGTLWTNDGIAFCTAYGYQGYLGLLGDGAGGVITTWADMRNDLGDIWAQQADNDGLLGGPTQPPQTVDATLTCSPGAGTVPFTTVMTLSLENLNTGYIRRVAGHIDVFLASGTGFFPNWRAGFTNIDPGSSYDASWPVNIPALGSLIGSNRFELYAMDVTPPPYNIFPFPPSGTTDNDTCVVYGIAP